MIKRCSYPNFFIAVAALLAIAATQGSALAEYTIDMELNPGKNLISLPVNPIDTDIAAVTSSISGKFNSIWSYQGKWKSYKPDSPDFSDLATMQASYGYWIDMKTASTLTITAASSEISSSDVQLSKGLNFIGIKGVKELDIKMALASIEGLYSSVFTYEGGGLMEYDPDDPDNSDLLVMEPGKGYWIRTTAECVWSLPEQRKGRLRIVVKTAEEINFPAKRRSKPVKDDKNSGNSDVGKITEIWLDVQKVVACSDEGCQTVGEERYFNLLDSGNNAIQLGDIFLPEGNIGQLRFVLGSNNLIVVDGESHSLTVPSGEQSGLKLIWNSEIEAGVLIQVLLDFDPEKAVIFNKGQGYKLKPTIKVLSAVTAPMTATTSVIDPDKGGTLSIGEDFILTFPPGAVAEPTAIWCGETKYFITSIITLGPEETKFSMPATVRLKYYPETIPGDYPEDELVVLHDFKGIPTQVDTVDHILTAEINHFSTVQGGIKQKVPIAVAGVASYERWEDPPVHVVTFDKDDNTYEIRFLADENSDGSYNLRTIKSLADENKAILAINGFTWDGGQGDLNQTDGTTGTLKTTTIMDNVLKNKFESAEVLMGFGRNENELLIRRMTSSNTPGRDPEFQTEFKNEFGDTYDKANVGDKNENPSPGNIMHYLFGSRTTIMENGECKGQDKRQWWSVIGYSASKVVMVSSDPSGVFSSTNDSNFCKVLEKFEVTDAVRLDGGSSVGLMLDGKHINPITYEDKKKEFGSARRIAYAIGLIYNLYTPPGTEDSGDNDDDPPPPPPDPEEIILEENDQNIICCGPDSYWHTQDVGSSCKSSWTYNNDSSHGVENYCTYQFHNLIPGKWEVQVFIPSNHATTRHACYEVSNGFNLYGVEVNQSPIFDNWVSLGVFETMDHFNITLTDVTDESYANYWVGFDAIRIIPAPDKWIGQSLPSCGPHLGKY